MSKNRITALCVAFSIICSFACEDRKEEYPDIRIGKEKNVDELSLNKQTEKGSSFREETENTSSTWRTRK